MGLLTYKMLAYDILNLLTFDATSNSSVRVRFMSSALSPSRIRRGWVRAVISSFNRLTHPYKRSSGSLVCRPGFRSGAEDEDFQEEEDDDLVELKRIPARPIHKCSLPDIEVCHASTDPTRGAHVAQSNSG